MEGGNCPITQIWYLSNSLANDQSRAFEWTVQEKVSRSFATCTPLPSLPHRGSIFCLPDVSASDEISQDFPLHYSEAPESKERG